MKYKEIPFNEDYLCDKSGNVYSTKSGSIRKLSPETSNNGYKRIKLNGKKYGVHQLMATTWLDHKINGSTMVVDHINEVRSDNRLDNLRVIHHRDNCRRNNKGHSKYTGVSYCRNRYVSYIRINGTLKYL